jgi:hypothetical protein
MKPSQIILPLFIAVFLEAVSGIWLIPIKTDTTLLAQQPTLAEPSLEQQADQLDNEARELYIRGDRQGAMEKLNQELSIYRRLKDRARATSS